MGFSFMQSAILLELVLNLFDTNASLCPAVVGCVSGHLKHEEVFLYVDRAIDVASENLLCIELLLWGWVV